ncbi:DNA-binding response regulator [Spirochaetia bacterium]|nr:DNA-binding response regulator [Spirochaetia bacterium]
MADSKLKVLLADDQMLFAQSLQTFLCNYADDMTVVDIALNGRIAVLMADKYHPDIILMDVRMPEMDGVEAVKIIKQKYPDIKVIMLSTYHEDELVRTSLVAGASGYLLKEISPTELITAIRSLQSNTIQISPEIAHELVLKKYNGTEDNRSGVMDISSVEDSLPWLKTLTKREREIFTLIATGYDNEQIADQLNLALQTVKNQISTIYSKLEVKDRFEIIRLANKH